MIAQTPPLPDEGTTDAQPRKAMRTRLTSGAYMAALYDFLPEGYNPMRGLAYTAIVDQFAAYMDKEAGTYPTESELAHAVSSGVSQFAKWFFRPDLETMHGTPEYKRLHTDLMAADDDEPWLAAAMQYLAETDPAFDRAAFIDGVMRRKFDEVIESTARMLSVSAFRGDLISDIIARCDAPV